ncbi:MAG: dihydropteroate synthase, partial [Saccharopolyspora sp.]
MKALPALRFGDKDVTGDRPLVMAIVNRTRDSFFDGGSTFDAQSALDAVDTAVADGADIVDIGGVRAGAQGEPVDAAEESRRVVPFVAAVRE